MNIKPPNEKTIFNIARNIHDDSVRFEYLEQVCLDDQKLIGRVQLLMQMQAEEPKFLESDRTDRDKIHGPCEVPGDTIGPYKLLERIGEGGMGTVYMAEQTEPVKRRVAIKLIKPGMDSKQVIARFEAERQAVALMDHPNIAKVFDAGTTDSGRPYFVMELVKGLPINQYCDENQLNTRQRLELFNQVCRGVQHAHQKGIIHRDIKPSNILIAMYDDKPVPKIIDFGVAKATGEQFAENTFFTKFGQVVGTLAYMSPEQGQLNQLDIDTRSDIYSLGAVLYELLAGEPPFDREKIKQAAMDEVLRMIREEEPEKPSSRLSSSKSAAQVSASRDSNPQKLSTIVQGELDWIVMKAIEKDRTRRYETANEFSSDIKRYLNNEAVEAGPPSTIYRFRKFARRNRGMLLAASIIAALLVLGTGVSTWQAIRATNAEQAAIGAARVAAEQRIEAVHQEKIANEVQEFWNKNVISKADPRVQGDRSYTVRQALDCVSEELDKDNKFMDEPLVEERIREILVKAYHSLGEGQKAIPHCRKRIQLLESVFGPDDLRVLLARSKYSILIFPTLDDQREAYESLLRRIDTDDSKYQEVAQICWNNLGVVRKQQGLMPLATECFQNAVDIADRFLGPDDEIAIGAKYNLSLGKYFEGQIDVAERLNQECVVAAVKALGADHPSTLLFKANLALFSAKNGHFQRAAAISREVWRSQKIVIGDHALHVGRRLANYLMDVGEFDEAESILLQLMTATDRRVPSTRLLESLSLAFLYYSFTDRFDEAMEQLERADAIGKETGGQEYGEKRWVQRGFATILMKKGQFQDALVLWDEVLARDSTGRSKLYLNKTDTFRLLRAKTLAHLGKCELAINCVEELVAQNREKTRVGDMFWLEAAAVMCVVEEVVRSGSESNPAQEISESSTSAQKYIRKALESKDSPYIILHRIRNDADFHSLRQRAVFQDIVISLEREIDADRLAISVTTSKPVEKARLGD